MKYPKCLQYAREELKQSARALRNSVKAAAMLEEKLANLPCYVFYSCGILYVAPKEGGHANEGLFVSIHKALGLPTPGELDFYRARLHEYVLPFEGPATLMFHNF